MKRIALFSAGILLSIFLAYIQAHAQSTAFTYQGSLNSGGSPASGNHDFEFALFDSVAGGVQLGATLTRSGVSVAQGVFSVSLDFGSQFPGGNRFLEIRVRPSGGGSFTPLSPRQPVNSSPYAINAAQLGGIPASSYATNIGGAVNAGSQYNINGQRVLAVSVGAALLVGQNTSTANTGLFNTFVGHSAGQNNTSGGGNTFVGTTAGQANTTGFDNSFFGSSSGSNNTGSNNSFFGSRAGNGNTDGTRNSFFGSSSGSSNTSGVDNAYFGYFAGRLTTTSKNAFFGSQAGSDNSTGANNAFFGALAGSNTTTGSDNAFFGAEVGVMNTVGFDNSFFGRFTGFRNTTGNQNSFYGASAGIDVTTGSGNSFFGLAAGSDVITGSRNSFFGYGTGNGNADGNHTSAFGASATTADGLTNATAIGARAMATQSNSLILGAINGVNNAPADTNVGIGTTAPTNLLTIGGPETTVVAGRVGIFSPVGTNLIVRETTADVEGIVGVNSSNVIYGSMTNHNVSLRTNNTNRLVIDTSGNIGIGTTAPINRLTIGSPETPLLNASVGVFNGGGAFVMARDTTNNIEGFFGADENGVLFGSITDSIVRIRTGNTTRLTFDSSGNAIFSGIVNMNSFAVTNTLDTGGSTSICRNGSNRLSTCGSSLRYKSNVLDFRSGLNVINRLRPVSFDWKNGGTHDLGLVAEDVAKVEPLLTTTNDKGEVEGVKYDRVGVVLINAVKEQQAEIEAQRKEINDLRSQIESLKKLICATNREASICKEIK